MRNANLIYDRPNLKPLFPSVALIGAAAFEEHCREVTTALETGTLHDWTRYTTNSLNNVF